MLTASQRRCLIAVLGVCGVLGGVSAPCPAVGPPAPPRPACAPFDLTYLPQMGRQGIVAFRPAEIIRQVPGCKIDGQLRPLLGLCVSHLVDCDPTLASLPPITDIEEFVLGLNVSVTFPNETDKGKFICGACTPSCIRTAKPFDWDAAARKCLLKATEARHAGRVYLRMPVTFAPARGAYWAVFIADDRTVALGDEQQIQDLIDRLKKGKRVCTPPGWGEVSRAPIALAFDHRKNPCTQGEWPNDCQEVKDGHALHDAVGVIAAGLWTEGEHTSVRVVATARDKKSAARSVKVVKRLVEAFRANLVEPGEGPVPEPARLLDEALDKGTLAREGKTLRGQIDFPVNVFQKVAEALAKCDDFKVEKVKSAPVPPPPAFAPAPAPWPPAPPPYSSGPGMCPTPPLSLPPSLMPLPPPPTLPAGFQGQGGLRPTTGDAPSPWTPGRRW